MTATMAAANALAMTAARILRFSPVCGYAGMSLLTLGELFSPTSQGQQQDRRKSQYQMLHPTLTLFLS
jgi:hypothetical protein